jgi:hypothetical protein
MIAVGALLFKPNNVVVFVELQCVCRALTHTITTVITMVYCMRVMTVQTLIVTTL